MIEKDKGKQPLGKSLSQPMQHSFHALALAGLALLALGTEAIAQGNATPPMPPTRPSALTTPPINPQMPALPAGVDPMVADFAPNMPEALPPASRAQMHKCGSEWQKMKASGAAADKTWLTFAKVCLVR
jgi:hypothetical protein